MRFIFKSIIVMKNVRYSKKRENLRNKFQNKFQNKLSNLNCYPQNAPLINKKQLHSRKWINKRVYSPISFNPITFVKNKQKPYSKIFYGNSKFLKSKNHNSIESKKREFEPWKNQFLKMEDPKRVLDDDIFIQAKGFNIHNKEGDNIVEKGTYL